MPDFDIHKPKFIMTKVRNGIVSSIMFHWLEPGACALNELDV